LQNAPRIYLTADRHWDPYSPILQIKEEQASRVKPPAPRLPVTSVHHLSPNNIATWRQSSSATTSPEPNHAHGDSIYGDHDSRMYERVVASVNVAADDCAGDGLEGHADPDVYSDEHRAICSLHSSERVSTLTPEILTKRWGIGLEASKSTLQATTQAGIRNVFAPGERKLRFRTDHLKYPHLKTTMYTDTMFARVPAIGGKKASQVYTNGSGYDFFFPIEKREKAITTIQTLVENIGAPQTLVSDGAGELRGKEWMAECRRLGIISKVTVPHSPWQNLAEASIREFKKNVRRHMRRSNSPRKFWDYCGVWCAAIRRLTSMGKLDNRTPTEVVTGTTPDISQYALFDWYEPVRQWDVKADFPDEKKILGRFLGIAEHCTEEMSFLILSDTGRVTIRKSVWAIPPDEKRSDKFKEELKAFDASIAKIHGDGQSCSP
jgi:hypothetical protein